MGEEKMDTSPTSSQHTTPIASSSLLISSQSTPNFHHQDKEHGNGHRRERHSSVLNGKDDKKYLKLISPYGFDPIYFLWNPDPKKGCMNEIMDIIRTVINVIPEIRDMLEKSDIMKGTDFTNYDSVRSLCKKFSKAASSYFKNLPKSFERTYADTDLLRLICCKAYNRSVDNEKKLNKHYPAFSSQTYGETSHERLRSIIEEIQPKENDIFVDLGSGVGNLVVQMAGGSRVKKSIGIEIADLPAAFAKKMEIEFKLLMRWFGKKYRPFILHHGDFLDEQFRNLIQNEATIIFINNYAFTADLEERIKNELLPDLKEGTKVISTKPYALPGKPITHRQLGDIASIVDVTQLKDCKEPCSWTSNTVPYYLHVINRAKLEHYFASLKNATPDNRSETPSSKSSSNGSRESSTAPIKNGIPSRNGTITSSSTPSSSSNASTGDSYGPTTRRKWNQYVNEMQAKKKDGEDHPKQHMGSTMPMELDMRPKHVIMETEAMRQRTASIVDTIASVADGTAGTVKQMLSPIKKKAKKEHSDGKTPVNRGRPRKNGSLTKMPSKNQISTEALEGMELMHKMTREACTNESSVENFFDPSFILTDLHSAVQRTKVKGESSASDLTKYPNLDIFINELKVLYTKFLDSIPTEDFVETLKKRDRISQKITDEGVAIFKESMKSHGVDMERPKTTMDKAKKFLQRYNNVVELVDALETEMALLDADSKELIADYSCMKATTKMEPDESPVAPQIPLQIKMDNPPIGNLSTSLPPATPSAASVHSLRNNVPQQLPTTNGFDQLLMNNMAENLTSTNTFASNIFQNPSLLQALNNLDASALNGSNLLNLPTTDILSLLQNGKLPTDSRQNGLNVPFSTTPATPNILPTTSTTNLHVPSTPIQVQPVSIPTPQQPSTSTSQTNLNNVTTDVNGTTIKKPRARTVRAPSNKKNSVTKESEDPAKKEEIDKQINNIVQIALEVDKSAKSQQERERKARNSEKRKDKNAAAAKTSATTVSNVPNASPVNGSVAGKKRTSTEAGLNISQPMPIASTPSMSNISVTNVQNPGFASPSTSSANASTNNLLYYPRYLNGTGTLNSFPPTTPEQDLMNLIATVNGKDMMTDALQSLMRLNSNQLTCLLNGQAAQFAANFTQQSVVDTVTNGANPSPIQIPNGHTTNGNPY